MHHPPLETGKSETNTSESQTDVSSSDEHCSWTMAVNWAPDETVLSCFHISEPSIDMCYSGTRDPALWETEQVTNHTLEDPREAQLFRFFVDKIGVWWDITNSENIWKQTIPALALKSPILLDSMFLFASQYIRKSDPSFEVEPLHYHGRLLRRLIPYLNERDGINDEATLAATTLLRAFEDCVAGTAGQSRLSTFAFFTSNASFLNPSSIIVKACFMAYLRAEVYSSLLGQQTPQVNYQTFTFPELIGPANDIAWANRMVWITVRILQWCGSNHQGQDEWSEFKSLVDEWEFSRPISFAPFHYRSEDAREGRYLPEIWHSSLYHVDGNQHYHIARIALAVHDPSIYKLPSTHPGRAKALAATLAGLKSIMAIARYNKVHTPAYFLAGNVLEKYASLLESEEDRRQVIDFLTEVFLTGWPTCGTKKKLMIHWKWNDEKPLGM